MDTSKDELLAYATKMRERGDTFRSIYGYLRNNGVDDATIKEIMGHVDRMETTNEIKVDTTKPRLILARNVILGVLFLVSGGVLLPYLRDKGIISTVHFLLMGVGLPGLSVAIK